MTTRLTLQQVGGSTKGREKNLQPTDGGVNSTSTNAARTELHSMITFHNANTRGSRAAKLRIAHLCVLENLSSTCFLSPISSTSPSLPTVSLFA